MLCASWARSPCSLGSKAALVIYRGTGHFGPCPLDFLGLGIAFSSWKIVVELRATPWFPLLLPSVWTTIILPVPMMFTGNSPYQDFLLNANLWPLLGVLYRLKLFPKAFNLPKPSPPRGRPELRLAVVSPFLDKQHGTEMCVVEQIERFVSQNDWCVDLYAQQVSQVQGLRPFELTEKAPGIYWHEVTDIPGPHLLKFMWWFLANHWRLWRDRRLGFRPDLIYTPGTNCLHPDVTVVHIVFHAFYQQTREQLLLRHVPFRTWPRLIHRKLYYQLIMFLERKIYRNPRVSLVCSTTVTTL